MGWTAGAAAQGTRGRVVMLVDNGVHGDSRVQKAARSAAEAGWDVVLLGRSRGKEPETWQLGGAQVRLLPMPSPLTKRRHEFRRPWLSEPLAYPPTGIGPYRAQQMKAWKLDLAMRRAELAAAGAGSSVPATLRAEQFAARVVGKWVAVRHGRLRTAQHRRRRLDGPWDRLYTRFWQSVSGDRCWRRLEPQLWDWELAFGAAIDKLQPDLIHANDFRMLGIGARAKIRAAAKGRAVALVWDAHEYLPGLTPRQDNARWLVGNCAHEREYAPYADAVITVSDALAELLHREHGLAERPAVMLNAPHSADSEQEGDEPVPDLRSRCGIGADTPLLAYCGGISPVRGLDLVIEAMPALPGVHLALVSLAPGRVVSKYVQELLDRAAELGAGDRVHLLPFVPHWQVAPYLSAADAAVSPLKHLPNHEIALSNKFFEYSHARLPLVVSDVRTMADTVRSTGQGEVFRAEDVEDYVRAVRAVLADPQRYRAAYDTPGLLDGWTWENQAEILDAVYRRLLPGRPPAAPPPAPTAGQVPAGEPTVGARG